MMEAEFAALPDDLPADNDEDDPGHDREHEQVEGRPDLSQILAGSISSASAAAAGAPAVALPWAASSAAAAAAVPTAVDQPKEGKTCATRVRAPCLACASRRRAVCVGAGGQR
jgi:hypothetical protein